MCFLDDKHIHLMPAVCLHRAARLIALSMYKHIIPLSHRHGKEEKQEKAAEKKTEEKSVKPEEGRKTRRGIMACLGVATAARAALQQEGAARIWRRKRRQQAAAAWRGSVM